MSAFLTEGVLLDRTAAVPGWPAWCGADRTAQPVDLRTDERALITLVQDICAILSEGTLAARMELLSDTTSSSPRLVIGLPEPVLPAATPVHVPSQTSAQSAIADIHAFSQLTNEQIAPLAGVSRRSVQAWVAGEPISARKQQRLCALRDALREIGNGDPKVTHDRLFHRLPGNVRPYDLFAEGRFAEAVDLALDRRRALPSTAPVQAHDLYAQLNHIEDRVELPPERISRRFLGRLRR